MKIELEPATFRKVHITLETPKDQQLFRQWVLWSLRLERPEAQQLGFKEAIEDGIL